MRTAFAAAGFVLTLCAAPAAFADCVDFSQARADRAAAALRNNPPTAAALGVPTLDGLILNASRTAGDPVCDGEITKYYYTTSLSLTEFISAYHANIRRRTEADGMQRVWFRNPWHGDDIFMTSGTRITVQTRGDQGPITLLGIEPARPVLALSPEQQPYSIQDIVTGTPWPGGPDGTRAFVRADGGGGAQAAQAAPASQPQPNCPAQSGQAAGAGAAAGAQAGAAIGAATGRSVGAAAGAVIGGILGSRRNQTPPAQQQPPPC